MSEPPRLFAGLDREQWLTLLASRTERMRKFVDLFAAGRAPPFLVSNEAHLIRRALEALESLCGDRATSDAIMEELARD